MYNLVPFHEPYTKPEINAFHSKGDEFGLDVSPFIESSDGNPAIYDLFAVVNHSGNMIGGHYTSYARCIDLSNTRRNEVDWRLFDDNRVTYAHENEIVTPSAYVLFYRRRGVAFNPSSVPLPMDNKVSSVLPLNNSSVGTDFQDSDNNVTDEETNNTEIERITTKCSLQNTSDYNSSQVTCNMDPVEEIGPSPLF
ncbi:Ubiquitin carboxyl-terminal hydrolase 19 [Nymphon striatum]|nr:Ubiquitin carboxyl-terminal hydrolase 19 [Nymphon striatum]